MNQQKKSGNGFWILVLILLAVAVVFEGMKSPEQRAREFSEMQREVDDWNAGRAIDAEYAEQQEIIREIEARRRVLESGKTP